MIESLFKNSRFLVFLIVISSMLSSVLLYISAVNIMINIVLDSIVSLPTKPSEGQIKAVMLLKSLDILLIALTFQIVSVAHYHLFISNQPENKSWFLEVFHISNFKDLKIILLKVAVLVLALIFLEQAVEKGATLETLYLSMASALMIFAIGFAIKIFKH